MSTVAEKVKETFESAKTQVNGFEKDLNKKIAKLEKKAKASLEDVKEQVNGVPDQLKGAWDNVVTRLRSALAFATRDELDTLAGKVDDLAKKVEKLIRGDKIRAATTKK
jgi:dsDNA-specific endonuclease/ATPase MutS2